MNSLLAFALGVVLTLVIVPVVSMFTVKPDQKHLEQVFSCYDRPVTVTAKQSIGNQ